MDDFNDADVKFVQDMIPHHQAAVDMAVAEYARGENADVMEWALAIWEGQAEEIKKFRAWLKERGLSEKRSGKSHSGGM